MNKPSYANSSAFSARGSLDTLHHGDSNEPTPARALQIARQLGGPVPHETLSRVFRPDLFRSAVQSNPTLTNDHEHPVHAASAR